MDGKMSAEGLIAAPTFAGRILMMSAGKSLAGLTDVRDAGVMATGLRSVMREPKCWCAIHAVGKGTHRLSVMHELTYSTRTVNSKSLARTLRANKNSCHVPT